MKRIAIFGNDCQRRHLAELRAFFAMLAAAEVEVEIEESFARYLEASGVIIPRTVMEAAGEGRPVPLTYTCTMKLRRNTALLLSLGGDGTFLRAAAWGRVVEVPVAGVNTGHLGYLTGYSLQDAGMLKQLIEGKFEVSPRMTLELQTEYLPEGFGNVALNEVSVSKGDTLSMVEIHAYVDGHYLADYQADGLVVSTPTGSTGYSLSCGGPIMQPTVECMVLSPIAPHSLTLRPLVVSAWSELRLEVSSRGEKCHVGVDGRTFTVPSEGTTIRLRRSSHVVNVAQPCDVYFTDVLRNKLRWGDGVVPRS